ncbi:universal stress protein [Megalodesulfovibrio gigas]|uniref:Putative UspA domain protein n=1 Tax=Megalodesulfovibrio gigas (strain ATCC 19364 / DSM 1382 / NCIMB 9332 / VKM B-1759) TaxID=1121448 RepID=T2GBV6_MEGG1|nr:universal stress protein [Megalodesulfovibrio gigas]AGW13649.1 putative UspA domain protein [Megalodesulfovibrio gigas DSM 1382 = ATCC 19364]
MLPHFQHILFASDLSDVCRHAMGYAFSLAQAYNARLTVLHTLPDLAVELSQRAVLDPASLIGPGSSLGSNLDWLDREQQIATTDVEAQLQQLCQEMQAEAAADLSQQLEILVKAGDPVETILDCAHDGEFDCIVVGSHGQGMVSRLLVGSVAEGVIRSSRIPVLVAPVHEDEPE